MLLKVLETIGDLTAPISHYDSRVFPDDSHWYAHFERYVSVDATARCIAYASSLNSADEVILPTVLRRKNRFFIVIESLDNYYSVDYRPICSKSSARKLITPVLKHLLDAKKPHLVLLRALEAESTETGMIMHAFRNFGWHTYTSSQQINWTHELTGDYADYLSSRSRRLRNTLRRKTAKLMALPGMSLTVHYGDRDLEDVIAAYNRVYANSWKVPEPHPEFIPQLIRTTAKRGQLRLGIIRVDDEPVAVHFWIVKQQIAFIYKLAHDKKFDGLSPGTVLMGQMIKHTIDNDNIKKLDFLSGDDSYKQDWMSQRTEKIQIHAYNPSSLLAQWVRCRDKHIKPFVKQFTSSRHVSLFDVRFFLNSPLNPLRLWITCLFKRDKNGHK